MKPHQRAFADALERMFEAKNPGWKWHIRERTPEEQAAWEAKEAVRLAKENEDCDEA